MSFIKTAFLVPAVVSGLWMVRHEPPKTTDPAAALRPAAILPTSPTGIGSRAGMEALAQDEPAEDAPAQDHASNDTAGNASNLGFREERALKKAAGQEGDIEHAVVSRQLRIERILMTIDGIAEVSTQMSPEQAAWIEPVLVDLAEQTLELNTSSAMHANATDGSLTRLENTLDKLVDALNKLVEPEVSL